MPPFTWAGDPMKALQAFEGRYASPQAGALFFWAVTATESLHYLDDIDKAYDASHTVVGGHRPDVVDVAHARWSTSTCITALDLCAAGLARSFCAHSGSKEFDLGDFDLSQSPNRTVNRRARLPQLALQWVDNVLADVDYKNIKAARDWLIHSRLNRHFSVTPGGPPQRLKLELQSTQWEVRCIVELSRDVATRHVSAFIALLPNV